MNFFFLQWNLVIQQLKEGLYLQFGIFDFNPVCYGRCQLEGVFFIFFKSLMCS